MITGRDVERYQETGYLVVENVLDVEELEAARRVLAELVAGARGVAAHTEIYDLEPTHRPDAPRVRRIKKPHAVHPFFARLARQPRIVAILQRLRAEGLSLLLVEQNAMLTFEVTSDCLVLENGEIALARRADQREDQGGTCRGSRKRYRS